MIYVTAPTSPRYPDELELPSMLTLNRRKLSPSEVGVQGVSCLESDNVITRDAKVWS
jgi:hypothetical protein